MNILPGVPPLVRRVLMLTVVFWSCSLAFSTSGPIAYSPEFGPFQLKFDRLEIEDGLSQGSVFDMLQDDKGYLWLGTQGGLNRYDGYEFVVYNSEPFNKETLLSDFISKLHQHHDGKIWAVSLGQLNLLDPETGVVKRFPLAASESPPFLVNGLVTDHQDRVLAFGNSGGLARYDEAAGVFVDLSPKIAEAGINAAIVGMMADAGNTVWGMLLTGGIFALAPGDRIEVHGQITHDMPNNVNAELPMIQDGEGRIWMAHFLGLTRFDPKDGSFRRFTHDPADPHSIGHDRTLYLVADTHGHIWVLGVGGVLSRWEPENQHFTVFRPGENGQGPSETSSGMLVDSKGVLWVYSAGSGVARYHPEHDVFIHTRHRFGDRHSLHDDRILTMFEDHSGTLWFGAPGRGVASFHRSRQKFDHNLHSPGTENGYSNNFVWSLMVDRQDRTWVGTTSDGVLVFDPHRLHIETKYVAGPDPKRHLGSNNVSGLYEDGDTIWISVVGNQRHVTRLDAKTGELEPYGNRIGTRITQFHRSPKDKRMYASGLGTGFLVFDEPQQETRILFPNGANLQDPRFRMLRRFTEDEAGHFWIVSAIGLVKLDREGALLAHYFHDQNDSASVGGDDLLTVMIDSRGRLWCGGLGTGLNLLDRQSGVFRSYSRQDGLPDNVVYAIVEDQVGKLWISSNSGLSCFDADAEVFTKYDTSDGLQSLEFNSGVACMARDGELLFGGVNGFNSFYPDRLEPNLTPPKMIVGASGTGGLTVEMNGTQKQLYATPDNRLVTFHVTPIDFTRPDANRVTWQLQGFDPGWSQPSTLKRATYTNLAPGSYRFRVKGANADGVWSDVVSMPLHVVPPFYQTLWFRLLMVLSILLATLYLYNRQRVRLLHRQAESLRNAELARKSEELEYARRIQLAMLPDAEFSRGRIEITGHMKTATEVGGDYFDFFLREDGRITIAYGDATGHGVAAGLVVGMVKMAATFWNHQPATGPDQMMQTLNRCLKKSLPVRNMGMSFGLATLDPESLEVELCSSGMPFPLHFQQETGRLQALELKGPPLGFLNDISIPVASTRLNPGDMMIFLSDGFSERFDPDHRIWGHKALLQALQDICRRSTSAGEVTRELVTASDQFARLRPNDDDMTIVVLRVRPSIAA